VQEQFLIGADYGHNDPAEEKALVETMRSREDYRGDSSKRFSWIIQEGFMD